MSLLYVAVGASFGAPARWWVDLWVQRRWAPVFPWGTFLVNVLGSFVLGLLAQSASEDSTAFLLLGIGFCGALTTFSSFAWESLRLLEDGAQLFAVVNVFGSLLTCVGAAAVGWLIGGAIA